RRAPRCHRPPLHDALPSSQARVAGDLLERGDVVLVREMTSDETGEFIRWTLRQVPLVQGGFMAMDVNSGRVVAMQGGFSYESSGDRKSTRLNSSHVKISYA